MILPLLQVILTALLVAYAAFWRRQQMKRRAKSWNGIISQLRCNDWGIEEISERFLYKSEVQVTRKTCGSASTAAKACGRCIKIPRPGAVGRLCCRARRRRGCGDAGRAAQRRIPDPAVCHVGFGPIRALRFVGRSIGECPSRGCNLQRMLVRSRRSSRSIRPPSSPAIWTLSPKQSPRSTLTGNLRNSAIQRYLGVGK
jgi:hypothetical protein